ncbi:MAG: T9SS type A sorting domain-containing protein [Chitinophagaceae bacterium]
MKRIVPLFAIVLTFVSNGLFAQKTWKGKGAGGTSTDFNTASNWNPSGVPTATDNVTITITSDATITLSADASIKNLTYSVSGNSINAVLDVGSHTLTVNGNSSVEATSGNSSTSIGIGVNGGSSAGIVDFKGNASFGTTSNSATAYLLGNDNSKMTFRGNVTIGDDACTNTWVFFIFYSYTGPGTVEFDGTGAQAITWNNTQYYSLFNDVVIGNTNNPTVTQTTGTTTPNAIIGDLTINGSSVLNLGTSQWNRNSSGGTLTMNGTSSLKLGNSTGGQTGSNFPSNFSTFAFNSTSTVEYNGTAAQTVYASPSYGNLTLTNSSVKTAGGNLTIKGNLLLNSNTTLDLGSYTGNRSTSGGTFTMSSASTLKLGSGTGGQTGSNFPANFSTMTIDAASTVEYTGTSAQTVYALASPGYGNLTLTNNSIKTAGGNLTIRANLLLNSNTTLDLDTYTGNRTTAGGTLTMNSGSKLILGANTGGQTGSNFPKSFSTLTLDAASTIEYDGTSAQTIYTIASPGYGNLTVTNNSVKSAAANLTIRGDVTVNSNATLNLATYTGNRSSSGGTLTLNSGSVLQLGKNTGGQTGSNFPTNFSTLTIDAASTVEYNSTSAQTIYAVASPGYGNLTVSSNSIKTAGNNLIIRGDMLINSTATFAASTFSHTVGGDWSNSGTFTAGTSTVTLNGSSQQNITGSTLSTFYKLTFNNTANNSGGDIILNGVNAAISNSGTFTDGIVNSTTSNMLVFNNGATTTGASNASFVSVKVQKIGKDIFTFPVGKINVGYVYCGISAPANTTDAFTAEYIRSSGTLLGSITASGLLRVSACEYWQIDRTVGTSSVNVTLSWSGVNPCNAAAYVTQLASLLVAHFDGTHWNVAGKTSYTGNASAGSITWNGVSNFSPFTIGSNSALDNPLQVKFTSIKAYSVTGGNRIEWTNATEESISKYEVERSADGVSFNSILSISPNTNNGGENSYSETDEKILAGVNYYRVKAINLNGSSEYSVIVKVTSSGNKSYATVYPNPVAGTDFTLQMSNYTRGNYTIRLMNSNGQQLLQKSYQHSGGSAAVSIERTEAMQAGVYILQLAGDNVNERIKLVIR